MPGEREIERTDLVEVLIGDMWRECVDNVVIIQPCAFLEAELIASSTFLDLLGAHMESNEEPGCCRFRNCGIEELGGEFHQG